MYGNKKFTKRKSKKNNKYGGFQSRGVTGDYNSNFTKRQLNIFLHPFSTSTVMAKIPDGKVTLSSAQRRQRMTVVESAQPGNANNGVVWLAVVPAINNTLIYAAQQTTSGGPPNDGTILKDPDDYNPVWFDPPATAGGTDFVYQGIKEFRIVSAGVKISLTNDTNSNNGYWEAIRLPNASPDMNVVMSSVTEYAKTGSNSFIDQPSYCTGKLKDIHKYTFQCKPDGNSHDLTQYLSSTEAFYNTVDITLDIVLIKITGLPGDSNNSAPDANPPVYVPSTKMIVHSISNQEVTYAPDAAYHRFMTESTYDSRFDMAVHAASVNIKAATRNYQNA